VCGQPTARVVEASVIFGQDPISVEPNDVSDTFGQEQYSDMNTVVSFPRFDGQSMKPGPIHLAHAWSG
jgi:hypothetical protein